MTRIGVLGLIVGGLAGLLIAILIFSLLAQQAVSPVIAQSTVPTADVNFFLSERILSRLASDELQRPALLDFKPDGWVEITTRTEIGGVEPVVRLGLSLEMRGSTVTSRLHWAKIGFLTIPANRLPENVVALGSVPGQAITRQIPPEFTLVGLTTLTDGLNFQLNWAAP